MRIDIANGFQPHGIDDGKGCRKKSPEDPGEVPHFQTPKLILVQGMLIFENRGFRHRPPNDLIDPSGIEQHNRKKDHGNPKGNQQGFMT